MKPAVPAPIPANAATPPKRLTSSLANFVEWQREYFTNSTIRKIAAWCAAYLLFFRISSIQQIIGIRGLQHVPALIGLLGVLTAGGLQRIGLLKKPMVYWTAFYLWVAVSVPFSAWPGGTFNLLKFLATTTLPFFLVLAGSVVTWKECKRLAYAVALAGAVILVISRFLVQEDAGGRAMLEGNSGIANSNDLAAILLVVIPFFLFTVLRPATNWFLRCGAVAAIAYALYQVVRTGSRGGLLALAAMMIIVLLRSTTKQRIGLVAGGCVLLGLSFLAIPENIKARLFSFSSDVAEGAQDEAAQSKEIRVRAMKLGLKTMIHRPLFGCGPGVFMDFINKSELVTDNTRDWHEIHNAYLRAGAEIGFPGLFFFVAPWFWVFRNLSRVYRRARSDLRAKEIADLGHCLTIALTGLMVSIFFLPWQFEAVVPSMCIFAVLYIRIAGRELSVLGIPENAGARRIVAIGTRPVTGSAPTRTPAFR